MSKRRAPRAKGRRTTRRWRLIRRVEGCVLVHCDSLVQYASIGWQCTLRHPSKPPCPRCMRGVAEYEMRVVPLSLGDDGHVR